MTSTQTLPAIPSVKPADTAESVNCPLCDGVSERVFEKHGFPIRECVGCLHRFTGVPVPADHTACVYDDNYFFGGGAGYDNYLEESQLLTAHGRRYARIAARYMEPASVIDVGAAAGFLLQGFRQAGWTGCGIEPNDTVARHARETLGLDVRTSSLEDFDTVEQFDLALVIQVMGHLVDPVTAAQRISRLVRPGGFCLVETWNVRSWTARLFGSAWHEYSPPSVLHWYSPQTVQSLFSKVGFSPVTGGIPQKWISAGHAKSLLKYKARESFPARIASTFAAVLPDRLKLPYPSEDLFWTLLKRQT